MRGIYLIFAAALVADGQAVRAWQNSIKLPTYREGPADPKPQFAIYSTDKANYPYPERASFTKDRQDRAWRTLNLENQYLFCRVLPDLGGHLYSCRDKRNGREMFYANPVIKWADVGLRGAWAALGIESNFPVGHSRDSASPVDFAVTTDDDGSGHVIVANIDRISEMQWRVEYILRPASTVLESRVTLYNRSHARRRYYWWANAAVEFDDPNTRFILPSRLVASHGLTEIDTWPISSAKKDESLVKNHKDAATWFGHGCREPFFAVHKPVSRSGVAHYADPKVVTGKKIWIWGSNADAAFVRHDLTDNFSSYVEFQNGLTENQEAFLFLEPEQTRNFSEYWIPIHDLGGVARVTRDVVANFERRADRIAIELSATRLLKDATIRLRTSERTVFEAHADLDPAATYSHLVDKPDVGRYSIEVLDSQGAMLLEHTEDRYDADSAETARLGKQPLEKWNGPEETEAFLLARGNHNELHGQLNFAHLDYTTGLKKFPQSVPLQKAAGRLALTLNRFEEAAAFLVKVPSDDETAYSLGVAQAMLGRTAEARRALNRVSRSSTFGPAASIQLASIAAKEGDFNAALAAAERVPESGRAIFFKAALARRAGQKDAARKLIARDPADSTLRFERTLLGDDDPALWQHLAADSARVIQVAEDYLSIGFYEDAERVLAHSYTSPDQLEPGAIPPARDPLVAYYRAFCKAKLNRPNADDLHAASENPVRYVFPHHPGSIDVLKSAIAANPSDATAHVLLGRLYLHGLMVDEAVAEWDKARALNSPDPELYRDLSRVLIELKKDVAGGLLVLRAGLKIDPQSSDLRAAVEHSGSSLEKIVAAPAAGTSGTSLGSVAAAALLKAASGLAEDGSAMFEPKTFSADKQPDDVRRAYIEVQLQRLMMQTKSGNCRDVIDRLDKLGSEDGRLAFTMYGFNNFMKPAHFQYYMGTVEAFCNEDKSARKQWSKVAKMNDALPSPEFVFPILAAWRLNPADAKSRIASALEAVRQAGSKSKPPLMYVEGILLRMSGQEMEAAKLLQEVVKNSQDVFLTYLAQVGLREMFGR